MTHNLYLTRCEYFLQMKFDLKFEIFSYDGNNLFEYHYHFENLDIITQHDIIIKQMIKFDTKIYLKPS